MRFWVFALCVVAGCGSPAEPRANVFGVVTLDGTPTSGLAVRLIGTDGTSYGGMTGADGRVAFAGVNGLVVPPGTYKVTVRDGGEDEPDPMAVPAKKVASRVPASYGAPATSPLSLTVEANQSDYPIEVVSRKS